MTPEPIDTNPDNNEHPPEISDDDWTNTPGSIQKIIRLIPAISDDDKARTPISVQEFVRSLLKEKLEWQVKSKRYTPIWPTPFMLFLNVIIAIVIVFLLANRIVAKCIFPPEVSKFSAAIILLVVFHMIWRYIYYAFIPPNYQQTIEEKVGIGVINIPITYLITFFNEIQPWKLSSRRMVMLLFILITAGAYLNLSSYSLFYVRDEPSLQGFSIERLGTPPEWLPLEQPLVIKPEEKVFVEAVLLGGVEASCTWTTATGKTMVHRNCSTVFAVRPGIVQDVLTVIVKPTCGTRQESVNIPVVVQQ